MKSVRLGVSVLVGVGLAMFLPAVFFRPPGGEVKSSGHYRPGLRRGGRHSPLKQLGR